MDNKYLEKILNYLVKGTKIYHEKETIYFPFRSCPNYSLLPQAYTFPLFPSSPPLPFPPFCKNQFGLTEEEIEYVWKEYRKIIKKKLKNGE